MPKSKYPKSIRDKKSSRTRRAKKEGILTIAWPIIKLLAKTIVAIVGIVSAVLGILSLFSNISVEALEPLQKGDLKSTPMQITNNSFLAIHNVSYICTPRVTKTPTLNVIGPKKGATLRGFLIKRLERGETATTELPFSFLGGPVISTDFDFKVTYQKFSILPFISEKTFRFASAKNSDGDIILLKRAISEQ